MNKIKVLIADDNKVISESIKKIIDKKDEIEIVAIANDGEEEYEFIKEFEPDFLFSDIQMPKMTGIEVLEKLENEKYKKMPQIVFVTGEYIDIINDSEIIKYVYDFINKPFSPEKILNAIENYICENKNN